MLTCSRVPSLSGLSDPGSVFSFFSVLVLTLSGALPWLGRVESEGGGSSVTDGSEVSAAGHRDGDCWDGVLLLVGSQEGWL